MILGWSLGTWKCSIVPARVASRAQHHINLGFLLSDRSRCKPVCLGLQTEKLLVSPQEDEIKQKVSSVSEVLMPLCVSTLSSNMKRCFAYPLSKNRWACLMKGPTLESLSGLLLLMWGKAVLKKKEKS